MTYTINATNSVFTNVANTNAFELTNDSRTVAVDADGFLFSATRNGIGLYSNAQDPATVHEHRATILGSVYGANAGILVLDAVDKPSTFSLFMYAGGSVSGNVSGVATYSTQTVTLTNNGSISSRLGDPDAASVNLFFSQTSNIFNTGLISSSYLNGCGIKFVLGGTNVIENSGVIRGATHAILSVDTFGTNSTASKETITNTGQIIGAISLGAGDDTFSNNVFGVINGTVSMGEGADTFSNFGSINGFYTVNLDGGADKFIGGDGDDRADGGAGSDNMNGGAGGDFLFGGADADALFGGSGSDLLNGGAGGDVLNGGQNTDRADYGNAAAGVTARLDNSALNMGDAQGDTYISIENLNGSSHADVLVGDGLVNSINGFGGNDLIYGLGGADSLLADEGFDLLEGGAGADFLDGGSEFDYAVYAFASTGVVANLANSAANTGDAAGDSYSKIEGLGGSNFGDALVGDAGNNALNGGLGNDYLAGGAGADAFVFTTALNTATNFDRLTDFRPVDDIIWLQQANVFNAIAKGSLAAANFVIGSVALDANDRIIYNQANGNIFYDPDGNGATARILFAQVAANTVLTSADFFVI
ncbi:MAG: calcium-binding protein [Rhizobiaceae bacterium]